MTTKYCPCCKEHKLHSEFHAHNSAPTILKLQSHCKVCKKVQRAVSRADNLEATRKRDLNAYYNNYDNRQASRKKYNLANRDKSAAWSAKRRAVKLLATPKWANNEAVQLIYTKSQRLSVWLDVEYHVDHIVPLQSKFVCGLHCEANLQIIVGVENISKLNRHWPDMWEQENEQT